MTVIGIQRKRPKQNSDKAEISSESHDFGTPGSMYPIGEDRVYRPIINHDRRQNMAHLLHSYRSPNTEATLPDVFFVNDPLIILIGVGGSAISILLAVAAPGSLDSQIATILNTIWIAGWTMAGLYRVYRWATAPHVKPNHWVQPVSDDDTPVWKGK